MLLVTTDTVGAAAYARMVREGVIAPVLAGVAIPRDIALTPALRHHALAAVVPQDAQATALAALWAHGCAPVPDVIDLRCHARQHSAGSLPGPPTIVHVVHGHEHGTMAPVADVAQAASDALRWSPLALAVPAVLCALDAGLVTGAQLRAGEVAGGREGLVAVEEAVRQREASAVQVRLEPVMRRAS